MSGRNINFINLFGNSLIVVIGGLIFQLIVTTLAAYSLARLKPIGGRIIMWGFLVTLMIPQHRLHHSALHDAGQSADHSTSACSTTIWGCGCPTAVNAFGIFLMKTFFESIPTELYDAAKVDGASPLRIFWSITLPLSRSILVVLTIVGFLALWKDFLLPLLVLPNPNLQPITVRLFYMLNVNSVPAPLNMQMAASFLALLPPLVIAIVLQRYFQQGLSIGAVKG